MMLSMSSCSGDNSFWSTSLNSNTKYLTRRKIEHMQQHNATGGTVRSKCEPRTDCAETETDACFLAAAIGMSACMGMWRT